MQKINPLLTANEIENKINEQVELFLDRQKMDLYRFIIEIRKIDTVDQYIRRRKDENN